MTDRLVLSAKVEASDSDDQGRAFPPAYTDGVWGGGGGPHPADFQFYLTGLPSRLPLPTLQKHMAKTNTKGGPKNEPRRGTCVRDI